MFPLLAGQKDCHCVTGLGSNAILLMHVASLIKEVRQQAAGYRRYHTFFYQTQSWSALRKVVAKVEMTEHGLNTRFISTDMMEAKAIAARVTVLRPTSSACLCIRQPMC